MPKYKLSYVFTAKIVFNDFLLMNIDFSVLCYEFSERP